MRFEGTIIPAKLCAQQDVFNVILLHFWIRSERLIKLGKLLFCDYAITQRAE